MGGQQPIMAPGAAAHQASQAPTASQEAAPTAPQDASPEAAEGSPAPVQVRINRAHMQGYATKQKECSHAAACASPSQGCACFDVLVSPDTATALSTLSVSSEQYIIAVALVL